MQDLLVIGGGINGAGIARDAAGRGMAVTLCEKDDLAAHTSSASTKLVHGGLRYLEQYDFRLVAESLREREVLLRSAPHVVSPLRFVMPHERTMRPAWMLRLGLFIYDRLGGRSSMEGSRAVSLRQAPFAGVLKEHLSKGFAYSDCQVDDARLVVLAAMDARERGAAILTRTECTAAERLPDRWRATLRDAGGGTRVVEARALVNAAGPWVDGVAKMALGTGTAAHLRLVKGSHIVLARKYPGDHAFLFQLGDGRIVFAIPWQRDFTLIGTTDLLYEGDLDQVEISPDERAYLREAAGHYFQEPVAEQDIVWAYAGVRPLYEDHAASNSTVTRDYVFELEAEGGAPLLSVYGGKITTFRKLAEHALERLGEAMMVPGSAWTRDAPLPGGDMPGGDFAAFLVEAGTRYPWLPTQMRERMARAYGSRITAILGEAETLEQLGEHFGGDFYEAELHYLIEQEFALAAEDVLWRRSKLGLQLSAQAQLAVAENMKAGPHFA